MNVTGDDDSGPAPRGAGNGASQPIASPHEEPIAHSAELNELFSTMVRQHQLYLYRFVLRNIGNPSDAEDIAQQTFVEAYKAMASFRGESKMSTWLYGIAMNLVRNYLNRAPHRVREYESEEVLDTLPDQGDGPDIQAHRAQVLGRLAALVEEMPPDLQQIFMLVAVEGLSYETAATMLELPIGTVRSRLFRARESIKERVPDLYDALRA